MKTIKLNVPLFWSNEMNEEESLEHIPIVINGIPVGVFDKENVGNMFGRHFRASVEYLIQSDGSLAPSAINISIDMGNSNPENELSSKKEYDVVWIE